MWLKSQKAAPFGGLGSSLLSVTMLNTMSKSNLKKKGFIWLTFPSYSILEGSQDKNILQALEAGTLLALRLSCSLPVPRDWCSAQWARPSHIKQNNLSGTGADQPDQGNSSRAIPSSPGDSLEECVFGMWVFSGLYLRSYIILPVCNSLNFL